MLEFLILLETEEDRISFQDLYEKSYLKLLSTAKGIIHSEYDAEEIVHDVYVKIADNFPYYRTKPLTDVIGLGVVMTRNGCIDRKRQKERHGDVSFEQNAYSIGSGNVLEEIVWEETREELAVAFRKLRQSDKDILTLKYYYNLTYKEISVTLGIQEKNVDIRLYRARARLKDFMADPNRQRREE